MMNNHTKRFNMHIQELRNTWLINHITTYRWIILLITTFTQATMSLIIMGVGTLGPFLVSEFNLSKTHLGFIGGAINGGMLLTALLAGRAVDIWGEKKVLVAGGIVAGVSILLASTADSFIALFAALLFTGLWTATSTPAGSKAVMTWFPFSKRAFALGIRQTGAPLGGMIASLTLPLIATKFGWRMAMVTMCLGTILGSLVCLIGYHNLPEKTANEKQKTAKPLKGLLSNKDIWFIGLSGMSFSSVSAIMRAYLVIYLYEKTDQSVAVASIFLALVLFGGIFGRIFWGYISDTFLHGQRKNVMLICGSITAGMLLMMLIVSEGTSYWFIGIITCISGFAGLGWNGVYITLISEIAGKEQAGTAVGIGHTLLQCGALFFPPIFGFLVDINGGSYNVSWIALSFLVFAGVIVLAQVEEKNKNLYA